MASAFIETINSSISLLHSYFADYSIFTHSLNKILELLANFNAIVKLFYLY